MDRLVQSGVLSHDEMVDLLIIMLGAGIITTADLIGNTNFSPGYAPPGWSPLTAHLLPLYDEALLTYPQLKFPAAPGHPHRPGMDLFVGQMDQLHHVNLAAGIGRDPACNPEPDRYLLNRDRREYAAFGGGLHHCLGLHLGKLEAVIALRLLLERYPHFALADTATPASRRGIPGFRGFDHLLVDVA